MEISQSQWAELGLKAFSVRMWNVIHKTLNYSEPQPAEFDSFVKRTLASGSGYGLTGELAQARFIFAAWLLGEEFHSRIPTLQRLLKDEELAPLGKSEALMSFLAILFGELLADDGGDDAS